jgi:hypothetical protein
MAGTGIFAPNADKMGDGCAPIATILIFPQGMTAETLHVIVAMVILCNGRDIMMVIHQTILLLRRMDGMPDSLINSRIITSIVTIVQPVVLVLLNVIIHHNHTQEAPELRFVLLHRRHTEHNCLYLTL